MKNEIVQAQRLLAANPPKSEEAFKILKGLESTNNKEVYGLLAEVYILLEDLEQALVYAKSALSLDEEFVPAWMSLGAISRKKGEINRALKFYSKANQFDTGNAEIAAAIADIYFLVGNTSGAESLYRTARNLDSNSINAAFGLAKVCNYHGAFDQAVIRLNEILEKDSEHQEARELLEKSVRGEKISISPFNQKNEKTEINDNETNEVDAWKLYLSRLPWPSKLFEEGLDVFEQSNANYLHALRYLSKIELQSPGVSGKQELLSESLELLLECFEKDEPSTPLYFLLSRALILAEKKEEAKFILQT
ncbi:MAG: hypothetical protein MI700_13870, partial [Balneolales bacterium]|nr:hypothetical protein [Balneolales bacterium]